MESANLLESNLYCCYKCKGLFSSHDEKLKHQVSCMGNPMESTCAYFACERKVFLQLYLPEDFLFDGCDPPFLFSKDDSFINHFVKIRVPDIFDPSIFLKSTPQPIHTDADETNFLIEPPNINTLEGDTEKSTRNTFLDPSKQVDPTAQDQIQSIINKNIEYLKNDDIPVLNAGPSKAESTFSNSPSLPRLLSPIDKHLNLFGDGSKSRLHSPFEKNPVFLHDGQLGYSSGGVMYSSNPSIPFSCSLSTDLFSSIPPPPPQPQEDNQQACSTNIEEFPTLQYLDLAKKDPFFGQNLGLSQINTKDPFLINASLKSTERPHTGLQKSQITRSCEDLQSSPTLQLQDGNYFNFPSTLDEPTQLDYLDLATLDFITNPNLISFGPGPVKERTVEKDDDIYSEDNILCQMPNNFRAEAAARLSTISVSDNNDSDNTSAFSRVKKKKVRLKKSKSDIERRYENIPPQSKSTFTTYPDVREIFVKHSNVRISEPQISYQPKFGRSLLESKDFRTSRKRKLDAQKEKDESKFMKINRRSYESKRISKSEKVFNVREKLTHLSEGQKDKMKAVLGQSGCIFVKKKRSLSCDEPVVYVNDSQVFGNTGIFNEQPKDSDKKFSPFVSHSKAVFDQKCKTRKLMSVLQFKCQECDFGCKSVVELKNHRAKHIRKLETEMLESNDMKPTRDKLIQDSFIENQNVTNISRVDNVGFSGATTISNSTNVQKIPERSGFKEQQSFFMVDSTNSLSTVNSVPGSSDSICLVFDKAVAGSEHTKTVDVSPRKVVSILPKNITDISIKLNKSSINDSICEQHCEVENSTCSLATDLNKETAVAVQAIENISKEYDNAYSGKKFNMHEETVLGYGAEIDRVKILGMNDTEDDKTELDVSKSSLVEMKSQGTEMIIGEDNVTFIAVPFHQQEQDLNAMLVEDSVATVEDRKDMLQNENQISELLSQNDKTLNLVEPSIANYRDEEIDNKLTLERAVDVEQASTSEEILTTKIKDLNDINDSKIDDFEVFQISNEPSKEMTEVKENIYLDKDAKEVKTSAIVDKILENNQEIFKDNAYDRSMINEMNENEPLASLVQTLQNVDPFDSVMDHFPENVDQFPCNENSKLIASEEHFGNLTCKDKCDKIVESDSSDTGFLKLDNAQEFSLQADTKSKPFPIDFTERLTSVSQDIVGLRPNSAHFDNIPNLGLLKHSRLNEKYPAVSGVVEDHDRGVTLDFLSLRQENESINENKSSYSNISMGSKEVKNNEIEVDHVTVFTNMKSRKPIDCNNLIGADAFNEGSILKKLTESHSDKVTNLEIDSLPSVKASLFKMHTSFEKEKTFNNTKNLPRTGELNKKTEPEIIEHTEMVKESQQEADDVEFLKPETVNKAELSDNVGDFDGRIDTIYELPMRAEIDVIEDFEKQEVNVKDRFPYTKVSSAFTELEKTTFKTTENQFDKNVMEKNTDKILPLQKTDEKYFEEYSIKDKGQEELTNKKDTEMDHLSSYFLNQAMKGPGTKQQVKTSDGFFCCDVKGCRFKTSYKSNVSAHYQQVHLALKRYICDQCTYATPNMSCLKHHMQLNHYKQKRFKCPDCDYLSFLHSDVVKHVRHTHMKQKQYACNQCGYRTGHSHSLKLHIMSHNGIRPYKCNSCEYRANNTNKVTRHIKLCHANEVGVACEKEDLTFEIDAKQFQCEEIISYQDIKVIELTEEEIDVLMKQSDEKKDQEKKAKMLKKKAKDEEKKAKKEIKKAAEVANINSLVLTSKVGNGSDISSRDVKVIKLTPDAAKALMEAKVAEKVNISKSEETRKYTKMLIKPKQILEQDAKMTGITLHDEEEFTEVNEIECNKTKGNFENTYDNLKLCAIQKNPFQHEKINFSPRVEFC